MWNYDETGIQAGKLFRTRVLARRGFNAVSSIILKSLEWLTINCVVNDRKGFLLHFFIFIGERLRDDYIKFYKPCTCMTMPKKNMDDYFLI
jgi:hypothetical protein